MASFNAAIQLTMHLQAHRLQCLVTGFIYSWPCMDIRTSAYSLQLKEHYNHGLEFVIVDKQASANVSRKLSK